MPESCTTEVGQVSTPILSYFKTLFDALDKKQNLLRFKMKMALWLATPVIWAIVTAIAHFWRGWELIPPVLVVTAIITIGIAWILWFSIFLSYERARKDDFCADIANFTMCPKEVFEIAGSDLANETFSYYQASAALVEALLDDYVVKLLREGRDSAKPVPRFQNWIHQSLSDGVLDGLDSVALTGDVRKIRARVLTALERTAVKRLRRAADTLNGKYSEYIVGSVN